MNKNGTVFKSSGVEWVGDVPEHWQVCKLKRLSPVKRGASPRPIDDPKFFDDDGEFSWVRISDVTASRKYLTQTTQKLSTLGSSLSVKLEPETFFVSIAASVGKPIITKIKCCIHDGFVYFPYLQINPDFLYYLFDGGQLFQGLGKLGTQLNLNTETIGSIHIPLPPNDEIQLIVDYLDRETTQIDNLIAAKEQMLTLLEEKREALISHAVTRGLDPNVSFKRSGLDWLGDIPKHWNIQKVKHSFEIVLGKMLEPTQRTNNDIEVPYLKALHIHWDGVIFQYLLNMWANQTEIRHLKLKQGDLLVCEGGEVGRATILNIELPPNTIIQNSLHRVRSKESGENRFLRYLLRHASTKGVIDVLCNRATIGHFTVEKFREFLFALPPKNEQILIADYLDYETSKIDELLSAIKESIALLKERRSALITAAVTGQIALEEMTS